MKIALFGGSFNPIHNGHLQIIKELLAKNIIDQVWIIPCGNHAFDKKLINKDIRMKMINLAIEDNPLIKVIGVELNNKKSYTSQTIAWFKKEFPHDFYFILGEDNLKDLERWNDFEYLKNNVNFILIKRPGFNEKNPGINITHTLLLDSEISSTKIRDNLKKGISIQGFVPEKVEKYIEQEGFEYE
jgi:nicotinate-nucleotide adenylyltransferase